MSEISITVNGEALSLASGSSLQQLLEKLGMGAGRIAVERNLEIVPRSLYGDTILSEGDILEVVQAIGGG